MLAGQTFGGCYQAEKVVLGSLDCIWLGRVPKMEFKKLLGPSVDPTDKASGYLRQVAKETNNELGRALALGREFIYDASRTLFAPYC